MSDVAETFADAGAVPAVLEGVVRRWSEADAAAAAGKACWWQLREAGMLAVLTCISEVLVSVCVCYCRCCSSVYSAGK